MAKITVMKDYEYCKNIGQDLFDSIFMNDLLYVKNKNNNFDILSLEELEKSEPQSVILLLKEVAKQFNEAVNNYIDEFLK
jgi:hypothetical protein